MADFGAEVYFDSVGRMVDLEGVRSVRLLTQIELQGPWDDQWFQIKQGLGWRAPNTEIMVIPTISGGGWDTGSGIMRRTFQVAFEGWSLADYNTIALNFSRNQNGPGSPGVYFRANIYEVAASSTNQGFGIQITNGSDFTEINDQSHLGFIVHKAEGWVNGKWRVPDNVPNRGSCIIFASWDNGGISVDYDDFDKSFETMGGQAWFRILVVSTNFRPWRTEGYGIEIYDANGNITLSNSHAPIHLPVMGNLGNTGNGMPWGQDSMISLLRHGVYTDRNGNSPRMFYGAIAMGGGIVEMRRGRQFYYSSQGGIQDGIVAPNITVPYLHAARYF